MQDEVANDPRRPLTELCRAQKVHVVTNGDDRIKIVVVNIARNLATALLLNYSEIPDSCPLHKLLHVIEVFRMLIHRMCVSTEELAP